MLACNESDTGVVPGPKGSRRPAGAPTRESMENRLGEGRRRTAAKAAGAPSTLEWSAVDWRRVHKEVWRLQVRIAEAVRQGRWGKVRSLQRLLVRSRAAKLWAVRRVTTNKGRRTPGVDGVIWRGARQKLAAVEALKRRGYRPQPLRRVYIPKKNQKLRLLSIPTMKDRAMQALYLLTLNPIAETLADPNSYGFRLRRSVADAWGQCFIALAKGYSPEWVFEGDIESCFDQISHPWLLENIPMDREVLQKWLEAGYLENATFHQTLAGTPQGGVISPLLANIYIHRLLRAWKKFDLERRLGARIINYADDLVIVSQGQAEEALIWLRRIVERLGLKLNEEKTRVCDARKESFDFLGYTFGPQVSWKGERYIGFAPSKTRVKRLKGSLRGVLHPGNQAPIEEVVQELNRKLRGWKAYFRLGARAKAYRAIDSYSRQRLRQFLVRRHKAPGRGVRRFNYEHLHDVLGLEQLTAYRQVSPSHALS